MTTVREKIRERLVEAGVADPDALLMPEPERGHWRCVFRANRRPAPPTIRREHENGWREMTGEHVGPKRFATQEEADREGPNAAARANAANASYANGLHWTYIRAEFFPEL